MRPKIMSVRDAAQGLAAAPGGNGRLLVGGGGDLNVQQALLVSMIKAVFRFVQHDEIYTAPDLDKLLPEV